jgi:heme/copper-type cytochrome/quinol oxidase subunit 2
MSDYWPGPGWRRADDGKWYPDPGPEAEHLAPPPPPPPGGGGGGGGGGGASSGGPSPAGGYPAAPTGPDMWAPQLPLRPVPSSLAGWLQGLFWLVAATSALLALAALNAHSVFDDLNSGVSTFGEYQSWSDADSLVGLASLVGTLARVALFVVIIVWAWRCHKATAGLNPGPRRWAAGWTIGGWFIPFASIVIPKLVLDETERIAMAPRSNGTATNWKAVKISRVGIAWWWLFVLSGFFAFQASLTDTTIGTFADPDGVTTYYSWTTAGGAVAAISAVLGALYTREVSQRLGRRGLYGGEATTGVGRLTLAGVPSGAVDNWAARTAQATAFCEICREPLAAHAARCPRCGKRRTPTAPSAPATPTGPLAPPVPPPGPFAASPPPPPPPAGPAVPGG